MTLRHFTIQMKNRYTSVFLSFYLVPFHVLSGYQRCTTCGKNVTVGSCSVLPDGWIRTERGIQTSITGTGAETAPPKPAETEYSPGCAFRALPIAHHSPASIPFY